MLGPHLLETHSSTPGLLLKRVSADATNKELLMAISRPSTLYVSVDRQGTSILGLVARVASGKAP